MDTGEVFDIVHDQPFFEVPQAIDLATHAVMQFLSQDPAIRFVAFWQISVAGRRKGGMERRDLAEKCSGRKMRDPVSSQWSVVSSRRRAHFVFHGAKVPGNSVFVVLIAGA